jgi:hypothetical protein
LTGLVEALVTARRAGAIGMNVFVRLLICAAVGVIVVIATAAIQNHYGAHSNAQLGGAGMIALVLAWTFTGMKSRS